MRLCIGSRDPGIVERMPGLIEECIRLDKQNKTNKIEWEQEIKIRCIEA